MAVIENPMTFGRPRLDFESAHDIDEFVDMLGKYERGDISPEDWHTVEDSFLPGVNRMLILRRLGELNSPPSA